MDTLCSKGALSQLHLFASQLITPPNQGGGSPEIEFTENVFFTTLRVLVVRVPYLEIRFKNQRGELLVS